MKPEIKERWLNAMRNGEYRKLTGSLRGKDLDGKECFCALGVLADLYSKETGEQWESDGMFYEYTADSEDGDGELSIDSRFSRDMLIPDSIINWAGFSEGFSDCDVITINDDSMRKLTFPQIADEVDKLV